MFTIRAATHIDLMDIVQLHEEAFPGFFMTRLGRPFLKEYYRTVLADELGILQVATDSQGHALGFAAGFTCPERFYQTLRKRRLRMLWVALPALLRYPSLLVRFVGNSKRVEQAANDIAARRRSELSSIGVSLSAQGHGIGKLLVQAFLSASLELGATKVTLTTDMENNQAANNFYRSLGFESKEILETPNNRRMYQYCLELTPAERRRAA